MPLLGSVTAKIAKSKMYVSTSSVTNACAVVTSLAGAVTPREPTDWLGVIP